MSSVYVQRFTLKIYSQSLGLVFLLAISTSVMNASVRLNRRRHSSGAGYAQKGQLHDRHHKQWSRVHGRESQGMVERFWSWLGVRGHERTGAGTEAEHRLQVN